MLKFDDQFPISRKVSGLSDAAFRLHVEAIFWCDRNLTDGFIRAEDLGIVSRFRRPEQYVAECVARGVWDVVDVGWLIHDYLDWQDSREKKLAKKETRRKAGAVGGVASGVSRRATRSKSPPKLKQDASRLVEPPSPLAPPTGGLGRGGGASPTEPAPHAFADDGTGQSCRRCGLLRINKLHMAKPKGRT